MSRNRQVATDLQAVALRVVGALRQAALPREVGDLRAADLRVEDLQADRLREAATRSYGPSRRTASGTCRSGLRPCTSLPPFSRLPNEG